MPGNVNAFFREDHPTLAFASTFPRSGPMAVVPIGAGNLVKRSRRVKGSLSQEGSLLCQGCPPARTRRLIFGRAHSGG